jgi:hypothetical protein
LPRKNDSRLSARSNVFLSASLVTSSSTSPIRIRNLSAHGALVDGGSLPAAGLAVRLVRGELTISGRIAWQAGDQAGISFQKQIDVHQWVRRVGHVGQQRVDSVVAAIRRNETPLAIRDISTPPSLGDISSQIDQICARLASTCEMTVEIAEDLLKLDGLAQALRQLEARGAA